MTDDVLRLGFDGGVLLRHGGLGRRENAVEPAQHRQRQDDLAILVSLAGATEQIADASDEAGDGGMSSADMVQRTGGNGCWLHAATGHDTNTHEGCDPRGMSGGANPLV